MKKAILGALSLTLPFMMSATAQTDNNTHQHNNVKAVTLYQHLITIPITAEGCTYDGLDIIKFQYRMNIKLDIQSPDSSPITDTEKQLIKRVTEYFVRKNAIDAAREGANQGAGSVRDRDFWDKQLLQYDFLSSTIYETELETAVPRFDLVDVTLNASRTQLTGLCHPDAPGPKLTPT